MVDKQLRAYSVTEEDEQTGGIVFARSSAESRRIGSSKFGDGDFNWGQARRAQWADRYAPGPVPTLVMLANGWWFTCASCERRIVDSADVDDAESEVSSEHAVEHGVTLYWRPVGRTSCARKPSASLSATRSSRG